MTIQRGEYIGVSPVSAIFVDIPNIENIKGCARRRIRWSLLAQAVLRNRDLDGTELKFASAYCPGKHVARDVAATFARVLLTNYDAATYVGYRHDKDIDSLIINDIWGSVLRHQKESTRGGHLWLPLQIRHVLVSGDAGYLRAYRSMLDIFGTDLEHELVVYSWRDCLSVELYQAAHTVRYLDDIPGLLASPEAEAALPP